MQGVYSAREGPDKGERSIKPDDQRDIDALEILCQQMRRSTHKKTRELGGAIFVSIDDGSMIGSLL